MDRKEKREASARKKRYTANSPMRKALERYEAKLAAEEPDELLKKEEEETRWEREMAATPFIVATAKVPRCTYTLDRASEVVALQALQGDEDNDDLGA